MRRRTVIAIIAIIVFLICCGLGFWEIPPSLVRLYAIVALGCFLYLIYYRRWLKKNKG
jgi:RsiW-degrading membrane proteinase PrsW (M82 family)